MATKSDGPEKAPGGVTELLNAWSRGDLAARDRLFPVVYSELRRMAAARLRGERGGHTLEPTGLVHEVFLRLADSRMSWKDRGHFYAIAAEAMRRVLVDHARGKRRWKRGAGINPLPLHETVAIPVRLDQQVVELIEAVGELRVVDSRQGEVVDLRFFAGLSVEETALALGLSPATIKREWSVARAWLHHRLRKAQTRASML